MSAGREGFDSNSSPVWGTPTANQELCHRSRLPALIPAAKEMSIRGMAEQESGREKCQSRNSWPSPQCKGDAATSLGQGSGLWRKEMKHLVSVQGSCLQKPWGGRGIASTPKGALGPKMGFPEGFLWDSAASLASRPSRTGAWAEPGAGTGPVEGRAGRGGDTLQITLSLLAVLGFTRSCTLDTVRFCHTWDHPEHSCLQKL